MDSQNIYISYKHYANYIVWEMHDGSEWLYVGADEQLDTDKIANLVNSFFEETSLYLITDRHSSCAIQKSRATDNILQAIATHNPAVANADFSKVIELNKIGVLRKGSRNDQTS